MVKVHNKVGFTIIEVVVSLAVLGIMAAALFGLLRSSISYNMYAGSEDKIVAIAGSVMEWFRGQGVYNLKKTADKFGSGNTASLCYFIKSSDVERLSEILRNSNGKGCLTVTENENFDIIDKKASENGLEYDYAVRITLKIETSSIYGDSVEICETLWYKELRSHRMIKLVSLRCN